jgi:hypothetical protein
MDRIAMKRLLILLVFVAWIGPACVAQEPEPESNYSVETLLSCEQLEDQRYVLRVVGMTDLPDDTRLKIKLFFMKDAPLDPAEKVPVSVGSALITVDEGGFEVDLDHNVRKSYSGPYLVVAVFDPEVQSDDVALKLEIDDPSPVEFSSDHTIGTPEDFGNERLAVKKDLGEDFAAIRALYKDLMDTFTGQFNLDPRTPDAWGKWYADYATRVEALDEANANRRLKGPLIVESRGRIWVEGLVRGLRAIGENANELIVTGATTVPEQFESDAGRFKVSLVEYESNLGLSLPVDPVLAMPHLKTLRSTVDAISAEAQAPGEDWGTRHKSIKSSTTVALFRLSALAPDQVHHALAVFQLVLTDAYAEANAENAARLESAFDDLRIALGIE